MTTTKKPLWECAACGQQFVTRNASHSCGHHTIDEHFLGKDPEVRALFDALLAAARELGTVHAYAQKTRIVFQTRARFVSVTPRKHHLGGHLWLKRPREHPLIHRIESLLDRDFVHNFRLTSADQLDDSFRDLLREAYGVGCQEMRSRYDFSGGVRGKYAARYAEGVTIVVTPEPRKLHRGRAKPDSERR